MLFLDAVTPSPAPLSWLDECLSFQMPWLLLLPLILL